MKLRIHIIFIVIFTLIQFSNIALATEKPRATGAKLPTQQDIEWMDENMLHTTGVRLNSHGIKRVNEYNREHNWPEINLNLAVPLGEENIENEEIIIPEISPTTDEIKIAALPPGVTSSTLPDFVDNSLADCFPPIGDQGGIAACAGFATTYYANTYMTGLLRGWNVKNSTRNQRIMSPKFTFNLGNKGQNIGMTLQEAYQILIKHGAPSLYDFPFSSNASVVENYTAWPTTANVWRNALNNEIKESGTVSIGTGNTPITDYNSTNLKDIKTILVNEYVLNFGTYMAFPTYDTVSSDTSTTLDDSFVGQEIITAISYDTTGNRADNNAHFMTIVGYNDNIWVDINGNGIVNTGEKGAFKVANSWGTAYHNSGFIWIAYDALNKVSAVSSAPAITHRVNAFDNYYDQYYHWGTYGNEAYWIVAKESYDPILTAEFKVNTTKRAQIGIILGYSATTSTSPVTGTNKTWQPFAFNYEGGDYWLSTPVDWAVNGTSTASDADIVLDFTDLINKNNLNDGAAKRFYLSMNDDRSGGSAILKSYKINDIQKGASAVSADTFPITADNNTKIVKAETTLPQKVAKNKQWTVEFSAPVMASTATSANITVKNKNNVAVPVTLTTNGKKVTVTPSVSGGYAPDWYTLSVTTNVKSTQGVPATEETKHYFVVQ
jgi:hypothetical protein